MSRFYFGGSTPSSPSTSDLDNDADNLPYPAPLPRTDFLSPDFSPAEYLSTLHNRHQTLEDLRAELRARSQLLFKELLDLVNAHYQDFLGLGSSLKGGDEKVEEVRVGLLGFRKEAEGVKKAVHERRAEVEGLLRERKRIRGQIAVGRALLDVDARLEELEARLMVQSTAKGALDGRGDSSDDDDDESEDPSDDEHDVGGEHTFMSLSKLRRHVQQYLVVCQLVEQVGPDHPFLVAQQSRVMRARNTLLLDLGTALRQAKAAGEGGESQTLKLVGFYREMDEAKEAVKVLKELAVR